MKDLSSAKGGGERGCVHLKAGFAGKFKAAHGAAAPDAETGAALEGRQDAAVAHILHKLEGVRSGVVRMGGGGGHGARWHRISRWVMQCTSWNCAQIPRTRHTTHAMPSLCLHSTVPPPCSHLFAPKQPLSNPSLQSQRSSMSLWSLLTPPLPLESADLGQAVERLLMEAGQGLLHALHRLGLREEGGLHLHEGLPRHGDVLQLEAAGVVHNRGAEGVVVGRVSHQLVRPVGTSFCVKRHGWV